MSCFKYIAKYGPTEYAKKCETFERMKPGSPVRMTAKEYQNGKTHGMGETSGGNGPHSVIIRSLAHPDISERDKHRAHGGDTILECVIPKLTVSRRRRLEIATNLANDLEEKYNGLRR